MSDLKVEGKVADWCPKCKNCKSTTRECDGKKDWLTGVECEDPYDGMIKTLDADSDICCSMFTPKPDRACGKYETKTSRETELEDKVSAYEKILNDILDTVYEHPEMFERNMTAYELLPGRVKFLKDSWDMMCDKYDPLNVENEQRKKAMDNQAKVIWDLKKERDELEKEKVAHMKGIERLKKANNNFLEKCNGYIAENAELTLKCKNTREAVLFRSREIDELHKENEKLKNQIKNLQYLNEEGYKREDKLEKDNHLLESKLDKLGEYYRADEKLIDNIQKVIFPQEEGSDYTYGYDEILNKVKELKIQSDEITKLKNENISLNTINKGLAEDRKKLINYMRSLKIASENYLKEFTYREESDNE